MGDRWVGAPLADDPGADVPTPPRWLASEPDDAALGRVRWRYKLKTYERFDLDNILDHPHPMFEVLQRCMRPLVLGMTRDGTATVTVDDPTRCDWSEGERLGITMEEMVYHCLWYAEFQYSDMMNPVQNCTKNVSIIDVANMDFSYLRGDKKRLASVLAKFFETHSPETNLTTFIVNTPGWFNWMVWPIVKLLLNKRVLAKLHVVPSPQKDKKYQAQLAQLVDMTIVSKELGGQADDVWNNKYQRGMHDHASAVCARAGVKMLTDEDVMRMRKVIAAGGESKETV